MDPNLRCLSTYEAQVPTAICQNAIGKSGSASCDFERLKAYVSRIRAPHFEVLRSEVEGLPVISSGSGPCGLGLPEAGLRLLCPAPLRGTTFTERLEVSAQQE